MPETAAPFVGRQAELEQLRQIYRATMSARKPKFVLIQGDFGVGKTTLVERFLSEAAAYQPPALVGRGKCAIETTLSGLIPFSQLFATLTEQGVQRRVVLGNLADFAKEVAPAWLDIFTGGVAGAVLKTVEQSGKLLSGQPAFTQQNVYVQFTNALGQLAEKQPVVAFIDDLHWADSSSLGLLFHLACYLQDRAVLFLCTYRPVEAMETGAHANLFRDIRANLIRYGALDMEVKAGIEVAAYAAQRYAAHSFPASFLKQVQELTDGHALFVSQLFSMWQDRGLITPSPGQAGSLSWGLSGEVETSAVMPQTLSEVLQERMRLVEERLRDILSYASVVGEEFPVQVIIRLLQLDEAKSFDDFDVLANRYRFIRELRTEELPGGVLDIYQFAHRFFREHIYSLLSSGKRRVLHRQVGECLEALYASSSEKTRDKIAGQLAIHFREAHDSLRAARFALQAARFEESRYAWDEAERWCELGLSVLERMEEIPEREPLRLDLFVQSGRGQLLAGRYAAADERYDAALELAQALGLEATRLAELCERLADIAEYRNQYEEMRGYLEQGRTNLDIWGVPFGEIHVKLAALEGVLRGRLGNNEQSVAALRQVLIDAEGLPETPELQRVKARVHNALGIALENISDYAGAASAYRQAIQIESKLGAKWQSTINMLNLAYLSIEQGQGAGAAGMVNQALKAAQEMGSLDTLAYAHSLLGRIHLGAGRAAEAVKSLNEAVRLSEQCGALWNMPVMRADLALAHLALKESSQAREQASLALAEAEKAQQPFESGLAHDALGRVEAAEANWTEAAAHFQQAATLQEQGGNRHYLALARVHWAEALIAQGDRARANELLAEAASALSALKLPQEAARTQKLIT